MASSNREVEKTLKQVIELFSDTDKLTEQLVEESDAKDAAGVDVETRDEIMRPPPPIVKPLPVPAEELFPVKKCHEVGIKRNERGGDLIIRRSASWCEKIMRTGPKRARLEPLDNAGDVAFHMYGFPANIGWDIQESMEYRKLIKNDRQFHEDEVAITAFLGYYDNQWSTDEMNIWGRVGMLKHRFKELKKKIFGKKTDETEPPKMFTSAAAGKVNWLEIARATFAFRRVLRNWVFHIEDVLFNFIIYELYYMLVRNNRAEAIFQEFGGKLRELREIYQKMVPITVHKTIYMLENPMGFEFNGDGRENLDRTLGLETMMDQIHDIMLRLMGILTTAGLSSVDKFTPEEEAAKYEETLEQIEEEMREIVQKINWEKLPRDD